MAFEDAELDVVIIGAGVAGLTAARDLAARGITKFEVIEARDRVGGRLLNASIDENNVVEMGGQFLGFTQTAVLVLVKELGLETFPFHCSGKVSIVAGGHTEVVDPVALEINQEMAKRVDDLARQIPLEAPWTADNAETYDSMTVADWLKTQSLSEEELICASKSMRLSFGALPKDISFLWYLFYMASAGSYAEMENMLGGTQALRVVGGTHRIAERMAEGLGNKVCLGEPVLEIRGWDGQQLCEIQTQRRVVRAKAVIIALSPTQASQIQFSPELPEQRRALNMSWPRNNDAMKAMLVYPRPFWRDAGHAGMSLTMDTESVYDWAFDNSPPDASKGVIGCFVSSPAGTCLSSTERRRQIIDLQVRLFGSEAENPIGYHELNWDDEQYTLGQAVSPLKPGILTTCGRSLRQHSGSLIWSGTETAEVWNGYIDGAVRSGHTAAATALQEVSNISRAHAGA